MFEARIYRTGLVLLALAMVVAAFSLGDRVRPLTATLAPDAFDGSAAFGLLTSLSAEHPRRRPGSAGDEAVAGVAAGAFRRAGFAVSDRRFSAQTIDGARTLITVTGQRPGDSDRRIVILAHRDAAAPGSAAELSGTAALLELAHVFSGRITHSTLTLVSTSGGSGGDAGALDLAAHLTGPVDGVLVLGDLAGTRRRSPEVVPFSDALGLAAPRLVRTVSDAVATETGREPGTLGLAVTLSRLAVPLAIGEQGVLDAAGRPAVALSRTGDMPPPPNDPVSEATLQAYGRAALRAVNALDTGPSLTGAPSSDVGVARRILPAWAVRLLVGMLILPVVLVAVDAGARARRRRHALGSGVLWTLTLGLPFLTAGLLVALLGHLGALGPAPPAPAAIGALPAQAISLGVAGLALALGALLWPVLIRRLGLHAVGGAPATPVAVLCVLSTLAVVVWVRNPLAAALLAPALHLWLWTSVPEVRARRTLALALWGAGGLPLMALVLSYALQLSLGPLGVPWLGVEAVAGGHLGLIALLAWSLALGGAVAMMVSIVRRPAQTPVPSRALPAAGRQAGPGSLGVTPSALRR